MAGSYFHLWLAHRAADSVLPPRAGSGPDLRPWLQAGAVAPDVGLFPGGPHDWSERVHREQPGDFLRLLRAEQRSEEEAAFVDGWALHLYADLWVHPWVEARVQEQTPARGHRDPDLVHLRVEWGVDCRLLGDPSLAPLRAPRLSFPWRSSEASLLTEATHIMFGQTGVAAQLRRGEESTARWLARLPRLLRVCGKVRHEGTRQSVWLRCADCLTGLVLGRALERAPRLRTVAALARPWDPPATERAQVDKLAGSALAAFADGRATGYASLGNPDISGLQTRADAAPPPC